MLEVKFSLDIRCSPFEETVFTVSYYDGVQIEVLRTQI